MNDLTDNPAAGRQKESPEVAQENAEVLLTVLSGIDRMMDEMKNVVEAEPGSCHAGDNRKSPRYVPSVTIQHSLVGALHCMAEFRRVSVEESESSVAISTRPYGQIAILRQALDMCALAGWLMDSNNRDERIRRIFRLEFDNIKLSDVALNSLGAQPTPERPEKLRLLQKAFMETSVGGLDLTRSRGSSLPTTTDMLTTLEKASWTARRKYLAIWQLASGFAHGMPWAYTQVAELEVVSEHQRSESITSNVTISITALATIASRTMLLLADLVRLFSSRSRKQW
jgi:hypothetical protein